jgi:hypothetical protein
MLLQIMLEFPLIDNQYMIIDDRELSVKLPHYYTRGKEEDLNHESFSFRVV